MLFVKSLIGILPVLFVLAEIILAKTERRREWKYIPVAVSALFLALFYMLFYGPAKFQIQSETAKEALSYVLIALFVTFISACTAYFALKKNKKKIRDAKGQQMRFYLLFSGIVFAVCEIVIIFCADMLMDEASGSFPGYYVIAACFIAVAALSFAGGVLYKKFSHKLLKETYLAAISLFVPIVTYVLNRCIYTLIQLM